MDENTSKNELNYRPSSLPWAWIAGIAILILCSLASFISFAYRYYNNWKEEPSLPTTQPIPTITVDTREQMQIFEETRQWPLLMLDTFDSNSFEWMEGKIDDEYTFMTLTLDGRYVWDATAKQGFIWRVWPRSDDVGDFYLAVDAHNTSDNLDAQYGLIFHINDDSYSLLEVNDSGYFQVFTFANETWHELQPISFSEVIQTNGVNRLEIAVKSTAVNIMINGQFVGEATLTTPAEGQVGLVIGLSNEGDRTTIEFDNFEVRAP